VPSPAQLAKVRLQVLRRLYSEQHSCDDGSSPYALIPAQDGTMEDFFHAYNSIMADGLCAQHKETGRLTLTPAGRALVEASSSALSDLDCKACAGKGSSVSTAEQRAFLGRYLQVLQGRPPPAEEYDQTFVTSEDIVLRVGFMEKRADLAGSSILFIGDADMFSLALAITGLPSRIVVLDVDVRVVEFINSAAQQHGLACLSAEVNDVRSPFPSKYANQFDIFITDPVETIEGLKLFFSHGVAALKGSRPFGASSPPAETESRSEGVGTLIYFGLTTQEASPKKWHTVEGLLLQMGFAVTDILRGFSEYDCTDFEDDSWPICRAIGHPNRYKDRFYQSAFLRCEAVTPPQGLVAVDRPYELGEDIYRDEEAWGTPHP